MIDRTTESDVQNFGGNVVFQPQHQYVARSEDEVLELLAKHRGCRFRVAGRLHSWSEAAVGREVLLDLRELNSVRIEHRDGGVWATAGGGCQIKRLLAELETLAGVTLPSVGLITEQTIAGAISTATHGSGKHCLSHYIEEIRIAVHNPQTGEPEIRTISGGDELRAARCALGCLGIVLSVGFWCRPQYRVEEHFRRYAALDDVLAAETDYLLQQFYLVPWRWDFFAQHRRETEASRSVMAGLYRAYWFLTIDVAFHLVLQLLVKVLKLPWAIRFFFRRVLGLTVVRGWKVVDKSQDILTMRHELFRHIEIEMFVVRAQLPAAVRFAQELLQHCGGDEAAFSAETAMRLETAGLLEQVEACRGCYVHHYPVCVRRILPDEMFISMSSGGDESHYSLSFISYHRPSEREGFFQFADTATTTMTRLFNARPHWGKFCPIDGETAERLYAGLPEFRSACKESDPDGAFRNEWVDDLLFGGDVNP